MGVRPASDVMKYMLVRWHHESEDEPVLLYSELDDDRWEVRKVEVYGDGRCDYANSTESTGSTLLGETPIPPLAEIAAAPEFGAEEISKHEFEEVWAKAHQQ
jgi:hypothetical protein